MYTLSKGQVMANVKASGAEVTVRTLTVTKTLLKQCRTFKGDPPRPFCEPATDNMSAKVMPEFAVGWFRGTVLGEEYDDFVLFAKDGDLILGKMRRTALRWALPPTCKQLYIA